MMMDELLGFLFAFASLAVGARLLLPLVRAYAKRVESRADVGRVPDEVKARLERMEQAIDSIAVEVERISEGQRFTTRLLTEQRRSLPERVE